MEWHQGNDAGAQLAPVRKLLLHTTEGATIEGAIAAYQANNSWPHETADYRTGVTPRVVGHLTADRAARSLRNLSGGVETNRDGVYQIEVVGFAAKPTGINWERLARERIGPLCRQLGVPVKSTVTWVAYPASYGQGAAQRLSGSAWDFYEGILGHQHCPENDHGDPGLIPIQTILAAAQLEDDMTPEEHDWLADILRRVQSMHGTNYQSAYGGPSGTLSWLDQKLEPILDRLAALETSVASGTPVDEEAIAAAVVAAMPTADPAAVAAAVETIVRRVFADAGQA